ncbi:hypothetical protein RB195_013116 [Necator americanus]|uniref:G protein-coupled receptor n=1 Tax=Necator americanus TaxID=51031 RepID=A0ABR1DV94_NECAM
MTLPVTPVYAMILILRRRILMKLCKNEAISENSRRLHAQLLKAITYQACIPVFFFIAVVTYALGQLKIINHPILEYSSFILIGFVPVLSPLSSLYFILPYRIWISTRLLRRNQHISTKTETRVLTITTITRTNE